MAPTTSPTPNGNTDVCFQPRRLGHTNLWVDNLKRSEAFYNKICGLTVEFCEPDLVATFLGTGNTPQDLGMIERTRGEARYGRDGILQIPAGIGTNVGLGHLAWELENEVELVNAYQRAKAAGVEMDITVDHQVAHSVYMFDPDGNYIEFYCDTVKNWRSVIHGEMDLITGGWTPGETAPFSDPRYDSYPEIRLVADAPVHPQCVTHAVLVTPDLPRLTRFYETVAGLLRVHEATDGSWVRLRGSHTGYQYHLAICQGADGEAPVYHHASFELRDPAAVDDAEAELKRRGVAPETSIDHPAKRSFFLTDPDGLRTEYFASRDSGAADLSQAPPDLRPFLI